MRPAAQRTLKGEAAQAREAWARALKIREVCLGADHPVVSELAARLRGVPG